jgi:hypothetical protein
MTCTVEVGGELLTVGAGGFQADVDVIDSLLLELGRKLHKPFLGVGEDLVLQFVLEEKRRIELLLGNSNTEYPF